MAYKVVFVGAQAHEQTPPVAVYSLDAVGRITGKIAVATDGQLDLSRAKGAVVALGPDVTDTATLNPEGLITLRLADQLPVWNASGEIQLPSQWWHGWIGFVTCLSGNAERCNPFFDLGGLRAIALGLGPVIFPERCEPLCNAVVEVWEYTTCCWPFLIPDVPPFLENLAAFLKANPIMFPVPPQPDPGPLDANLAKSVDAALGAGKLSNTFVPSSTLAVDLVTLRSLSAQDAVTYIEANPRLWPIWCTGSSTKLGETTVNPNGSFSFCYRYFPFFRPNCRNSYFYKVKQLVNGIWTYVYDGAAANQYFAADEVANLYTQTGQTCFQPPPLPGNDYIAFQAIGNTNTWSLNSNWKAATAAGVDQNQAGDTSMVVPLDTNAGLEVGTGAPWATTLNLLLNYDPALQTASPSPYYYRLSIVQADPNTGGPYGGAAPVPLTTPVSWNYIDTATNPPSIVSQSLGPVTVNGNQDLYQIPYFGGSNPSWMGNQFHQSLDTTQLANNIPGGPGTGNGQFLLVLEVFDSSGNRLVPTDATSPTATDTKGTFHYVRLMPSETLADVQFNSLTHILWVDNRPVVGAIDYFMNSAGVQICQYYQGDSNTRFYVGFQAYHAVMCDPAPTPSSSFMSSFGLSWQEGLGGTSGTLASGGDVNWTNGCAVGVPNAYSTASPPPMEPPVPPVTFGEMLGTDPITHLPLTACSFAITLGVYPKHTNGYGTIWSYESIKTAAVALSDAPLPPPCIPLERASNLVT